ncbi:restriction endonuclease [Alcaligenes faecalis]|nr:restriction endonuclease [Alcaligenes faecalis]
MMTWQEYQEAVAVLYEQTDGFGNISRNVMVPDKITGQPRQIDVLIEINAKGHSLRMIVDAKFHASPIDVRDLESVLALADAVGANKAIVVAANGWTEPAKKKADHVGCSLELLSVEDALDLIVPDKWKMCPSCGVDCIVLDQEGAVTFEGGSWFWWLAGQCRGCNCARIHCQDCGKKAYIGLGQSTLCECGHLWANTDKGITIAFFEEQPE